MIFPDSLPSGLISSNSQEKKQISTGKTFNSGAPIKRLEDDCGWSRFTVAWNLDELQIQSFVDFFRHSVANGSAIFSIKLRDFDDYLGLYNVYFDSNYSVQISGKRYIVTSTLIGEFVERVYPPPLFVPPLPFTWSSENKASNDYIQKIDAGTIVFKQLQTDIGSENRKYIMTEPFDLNRKYSGLIYMEMGVPSVQGDRRASDFEIFLTNDSELSAYSESVDGRSNPIWKMQHTTFNKATHAMLDFNGNNTLGSNYSPTWNGLDVLRMALDFSRSGSIQYWLSVNGGAWLGGGDPALNTSPSYTWSKGSYDWTANPFYFGVIGFWQFDIKGATDITMRIYGNEDHPFNYPIPAGFNGT